MVEYVCLIFMILTSISQKRFVSVEKSQKNISYATNYERNNHAKVSHDKLLIISNSPHELYKFNAEKLAKVTEQMYFCI